MDLISNVPTVDIDDHGIIIPETADILAGVLTDWYEAFNQELNVETIATPQGYLAQEMTYLLVQLNSTIAALYNGVDPNYASGRMQDAIGRIYFLSRKQGTRTTVLGTISGTPGTVILAGSEVVNDDGYKFRLVNGATIPTPGQIQAWFECTEPGAIPCPAGSMTSIISMVPGWDTVTNETSGIVGSAVEGRREYEYRRSQSTAINGHGTLASILGAVFNLDGVTDCYVLDNPSGSVVITGATNYELKPHSIYVAAIGGDNNEIAKTIFLHKDGGCDYNGNTDVTVYDESALTLPYPQYTVTFMRPTPTEVYFKVTIKDSVRLPSDIIMQAKTAIVKAFNGEVEDFDRERIGGTIFSSSYYRVITDISKNIDIVSILLGFDSNPTATVLEIGVDQAPVTSETSIQVEIV